MNNDSYMKDFTESYNSRFDNKMVMEFLKIVSNFEEFKDCAFHFAQPYAQVATNNIILVAKNGKAITYLYLRNNAFVDIAPQYDTDIFFENNPIRLAWFKAQYSVMKNEYHYSSKELDKFVNAYKKVWWETIDKDTETEIEKLKKIKNVDDDRLSKYEWGRTFRKHLFNQNLFLIMSNVIDSEELAEK